MEFSEKLQKLRQDKAMTQEQLAEQLFVSRTAISKWESGRGCPNINSLKAISKLFSISIDQLLSSDELVILAETETKEKTRNMTTLVFGILDCMAVLVFFLPLFGQQGTTKIDIVPLYSLIETAFYLKSAYLFLAAATSLWGLLTLASQWFQNHLWVKKSTAISLFLSITATMLFIVSRQPYAATLVFFFLLLKGILLIKRR